MVASKAKPQLSTQLNLASPLRAAVLIFLLGITLSATLAITAQDALYRNTQRYLLQIAHTAANHLDLAQHVALVKKGRTATVEDANTAGNEILFRTLKANPQLRYIYTYIKEGDDFFFILDAGDQRNNYTRTAPFIRYENPSPAFSAAYSKKKDMVESHPITDEYGTFISAYIPLFDKQKNFIAMLGADIELDTYKRQISRFYGLIAIGLILSLLYSASVYIFLKQTNNALIHEQQVLHEGAIKSAFLATASHELRTPLNSIIGLAGLLREEKLNTTQADMVGSIDVASRHLLEIIDHLLDLSKLDAGKLELDATSFAPHTQLDDIQKMIGHLAHVRGLAFNVNNALSPSLLVTGQETALKRVITNLINNAIKYTERGSITITAKAQPLDNGAVQLDYTITDTGIGIAPNKLPHIFERFVQVDSSEKRRHGGWGLGLALCKELVDKMKGSLTVQSRLGIGSTFTVSVQFMQDTALAAMPETQDQSPPPSNSRLAVSEAKILVADDNEMNRAYMRVLLSKLGVGMISFANDGEQAVTLYKNGTWTAVLMDCHMPICSGYEATAKIRDIEKSTQTHTPIIALTADTSPGEREHCLAAGMDEYLSKPVTKDQLVGMLGRWISFSE